MTVSFVARVMTDIQHQREVCADAGEAHTSRGSTERLSQEEIEIPDAALLQPV